MFHNFSEAFKNILADNAFMLAGYSLIALSKLLLIVTEGCFIFLPPLLLSIFLGVVFTQKQSPFYWKKFKKDFPKTVEKCFAHTLFKWFAKAYINLFCLLLFFLALLLAFSIMAPPDGMHLRQSLTNQNIALALGCLSLYSLVIIVLKAFLFNLIGLTKSWGEFKLSMIFS